MRIGVVRLGRERYSDPAIKGKELRTGFAALLASGPASNITADMALAGRQRPKWKRGGTSGRLRLQILARGDAWAWSSETSF